MGLDLLLALLHAVGRRHAAGELGEDLPEHALAAVAVDDALLVDEIRRGFRERLLRHAGGNRLLFQVGEEAVELRAVMARRRARGGAPAVLVAAAGGRPGGGMSCWADAADESAVMIVTAAIANRVFNIKLTGGRGMGLEYQDLSRANR